MVPLSALNAVGTAPLTRIEPPLTDIATRQGGAAAKPPPTESFGRLLDGVVALAANKDAAAGEITRQVLLGQSDQLHQSVIAMQEASLAFGMMVEVRNKLVESYQELMRMQV